MLNKKDLIYSTFIGYQIEIIRSTIENLNGKKGIVVDETKNLIIIEDENKKELKIPKNSSIFKFFLENGETAIIDGEKICFRPHERPKKV
jgi:ribonuclease P protein subunit POP4